jgi:hypothetical protein
MEKQIERLKEHLLEVLNRSANTQPQAEIHLEIYDT